MPVDDLVLNMVKQMTEQDLHQLQKAVGDGIRYRREDDDATPGKRVRDAIKELRHAYDGIEWG